MNPEVSARLAAGADVRPLLGRLARIFGTAAGLLGLVLAGGAVPILRLWLGARYDPAIVTPLRILLVGAALFVVSLPWHYGAIGAGDATGVAVAAALRAGVNAAAVSCVALTIGLTLPRAAVAASCAFGVSTVFLVWRGRSRLGPSLGQAAERVTTTGTSAR